MQYRQLANCLTKTSTSSLLSQYVKLDPQKMSSHFPMLSNLDKFASVRLDLLSRGGLQLGRASWHVLALKFPGESLLVRAKV